MKMQKGISVVELIIIIAVIGILTAIVIISRNPISEAVQNRNVQRQSDIKEIAQSIHQIQLHDKDQLPRTNDGSEIAKCSEDALTDTSALSDVLVTDYLTEIPYDPQDESEYICCQTNDGKITVKAPKAELGSTIEITR
ncbi:unnamed protein product [marine sediment metagenome]|uniref:Type II secretion system protein GspG C-terminal domain-containing protein n=1 Tax=marine sediment metagenome TaxID=412755 RepID=X0ZC02_9ZZZZ